MASKLTCEVVALAGLGEPAKRHGAELLWHCPHPERHSHGDRDPSLGVNLEKDVWKCWPEGVGGKGGWSLARFVAGLSPDDKRGVKAWLQAHGLLKGEPSRKAHLNQGEGGGPRIPSDDTATPQRPGGLTLEQYAAAKRLPVAFLHELGLSTIHIGEQPALRIPYYGVDGFEKAARFRLRQEKGEKGDGRFSWRRGSKALLYGLERIREAQEQGYVCLVEGESDRHTLCYHGIPSLGLPGASTWREEWAAALDRIACLYVFVESDDGGDAVLKWLASSKIRERVKLVRIEDKKDASALYLANPTDFVRAWKEALAHAVPWSELARIQAEKKSREARQECARLASCGDILGELLSAIRRLNVTGEERTVKLLYLAATSRLLPKPVSVAIKGPSSAGKSYIAEQTLRLFPGRAYYPLTAMSERALAYSEEPLAHRMLVVYEAAGLSSDFASYLMRSLLSEGRVRYETVEKTSAGLRPRLIEREGPTGLIVTTTQVRLHAENETRIFSVTVDDSQRQTRAILSALATETDCLDCDSFLEEWHALQEWLESAEHRVTIPYAKILAELIPPAAVRLRRDFLAILTLIRAHALLHQANRQKDSRGCVVATIADYAAVRDLTAEIVSEGVELTVSHATRETVDAVSKLCTEDADGVSVSRVAHHLEVDRATASRRVNVCLSRGYLKNLETKPGKPFRLIVGELMPAGEDVLPNPQELEGCTVAGNSGGIGAPPPTESTEEGENQADFGRLHQTGTVETPILAETSPFLTGAEDAEIL